MFRLSQLPMWGYALIGACMVVAQALVLYFFGQPFLSATGEILLWAGDPFSLENSQQISDWYSFSHIIHGFLFYWFLTWIAPRSPVGLRILGALGIEIGWEILENTPMVIEAYRSQALAVGYTGDSILNSLSDSLMMCIGFIAAWRLPAKYIVIAAIVMELFTAYMIRDNLTLNILGFIAPFQFIHDWQAGY